MKNVELPGQLRHLDLTGHDCTYTINFQEWQELPRTLLTVNIRWFTIVSLPLQWPRKLHYLEISECKGTLPQVPSESLDDEDITVNEMVKMFTERRMLSIPGIVDSLILLPKRCVVFTGSASNDKHFITVDPLTHKLELQACCR